jgi:hypothetical protein
LKAKEVDLINFKKEEVDESAEGSDIVEEEESKKEEIPE